MPLRQVALILLALTISSFAQDLETPNDRKIYREKLKIINIVQESQFSFSLVPGYALYFYRAAESNSGMGATVSFAKPLASFALEAQVRMSRFLPVYQGVFLGVQFASPATQPQVADLPGGIWKSDWSGALLEAAYEVSWRRYSMKYGPSTGWTWHCLEVTAGPVFMHHLITRKSSAYTYAGSALVPESQVILSSPKIGLMAQFGAKFSFGGSPWHWGMSLRLTDLFAPPAEETAETWKFAAEPAWHQVLFSLHFYVGVLVGARRSTFDSSQPTL